MMQFNFPKNSEKYFWTKHSEYKMKQYGLSQQRIRRVIRNPKRTERGIVKNTIAVMQPVSMKDGKWKQEIWAMYQLCSSKTITNSESLISKQKKKEKIKKNIHNSKFILHNSANQQIRIISAWRYPGVSPKNNPIPEEVINEILAIDTDN